MARRSSFRVSVHPRSRGEHGGTWPALSPKSGSSPLARGTLADAIQGIAKVRFIPARAGNTSVARTESSYRTGSSPLARGTPQRLFRAPPGQRFIPARAGNTRTTSSHKARPPVHPRSRGEHGSGSGFGSGGSSPLARGTHLDGRAVAPVHRFIPARAGNTRPGSEPRTVTSVHPRSRGEHPD